MVDVADIDEMNILQAALKAMEGAVAALPHPPPDYLLVDGNQLPRGFSRGCSQAVVRGDSKSTVIAAASILAKASGSALLAVVTDPAVHVMLQAEQGVGCECAEDRQLYVTGLIMGGDRSFTISKLHTYTGVWVDSHGVHNTPVVTLWHASWLAGCV